MKKIVTIGTVCGPRFKKTPYTHKIKTQELYDEFQKTHDDFNISLKEFEHIWLDILVPEIQEQVVMNPLGFKMPFYVGELKLQWLPYNPKKIDFNHKLNTGEEVPLMNFKNGNKSPKLKWERRNAVRYNRWLQFYGFNPARGIDKLARKKLMENPNDMRVSRVTLGGAKYGLAPLKK